MHVYLSGPITGRTKSGIKNWRLKVASLIEPFAEVIDPANKEYDADDAFKKKESATDAIKRLHRGKFVVDCNSRLIRDCDVLLVNVLGARSRVSIGCVGEIFWANSFGKPVILIREEHGNIHNHAMINAIVSNVCHDIGSACELLASMNGARGTKLNR